MPRAHSTINDYQDKILQWGTEGATKEQILEKLAAHNVSVSIGTLKSRLRDWGMAVTYTDLELWKEFVLGMIIEQGATQPMVVKALKERGAETSTRTLRRKLHEWNISVAPKAADTPQLRETIVEQYMANKSDQEMWEKLCADGHVVPFSSVQRIRRELRLYRKLDGDARL